MTLERSFTMTGAYDLTRPEPSENYGIHAMEMSFAVIGPKGAVNAQITTRWYLPHVAKSSYEMYTKGYPFNGPKELCMPKFTNIGYHAKEPQYEGQSSYDHCHLLTGSCYCDGSSLWGDEAWREGFLHGGSEWLFLRLEDLYRHQFENGPAPDLTPVPRQHPLEITQ